MTDSVSNSEVPTMDLVPEFLQRKLREHGQEHVLAGWDKLDAPRRRAFLGELEGLDLAELKTLYDRRHEKSMVPATESIAPLPRPAEGHDDDLRRRGFEAYERG